MSMLPGGHTDAVVAVAFAQQHDHPATRGGRIELRALQVSAHQFDSSITAEGRWLVGLRPAEVVRRVVSEFRTSFTPVAGHHQ
jgi:hypothetical protein